MQELLTVIAQGLVDDPTAVKVTADLTCRKAHKNKVLQG